MDPKSAKCRAKLSLILGLNSQCEPCTQVLPYPQLKPTSPRIGSIKNHLGETSGWEANKAKFGDQSNSTGPNSVMLLFSCSCLPVVFGRRTQNPLVFLSGVYSSHMLTKPRKRTLCTTVCRQTCVGVWICGWLALFSQCFGTSPSHGSVWTAWTPFRRQMGLHGLSFTATVPSIAKPPNHQLPMRD